MFDDKSIYVCKYCGEIVGSKREYCSACGTQKGRKKIFDENAEIFKANKVLGLSVPETLKNWK